MTSKPSTAPWADEPFKLIPIPMNRPDIDFKSHAAVYCASEMAQVHNFLIRGLNAIVQQAPYIPVSSDPGYNAQDVKDLLAYVKIWIETMEKHHHVEETFIFPEIEKLAGRPGLLDGPKNQHETFTAGVKRLHHYVAHVEPDEYRWQGPDGMKEMIDGFGEPLSEHLFAEIDAFLALKDLDSNGLKECWKRGEAYSQSEGFLSMMRTTIPLVLGAADKTYEGGTEFPPVPGILPYAAKYWFAAGNGAWRFSPCDFFGQPRPLHFVPQS